MKISREKINHISALVVRDFKKREELDYKADLNEIRLEIARIMTEKVQLDDKVEDQVRKILASYSRDLREGSPEWEVLFQKHYEEEMRKHGF
ncbi:MAG: DUF507 family protein [Nitrospinaceae bacterium]|nr:DUF507 family protein [Nitrospinaceae bacterium]NIR54459.1 DUF507 family protein [Nitrospinaceae bacterium]NIS84878.1 DUF507 family protein [Nitrospinaceae bacterium]NIT81690.1 DUF507 family protein [Nitrospinaceae bacterium]NIU43961.1 DUF507 family protein [Nitrospinaceae bacterium]